MNGFWRDMFRLGLYKRNQGRITRQVTFAALALVALLGSWRISESLGGTAYVRYGIPALLAAVGLWLCFRLVNMPRFADFLIAVEAEMSKVSWPTRKELFRGSIVVIVTIVVLATVLVLFDLLWQSLLRLLGVGVG
ncbi:MAG TPA: preprotein translocase subunit SecE [Pirellulales bacterium]|nr:preprotein translocase subunit SecE [Pirellulales bacterium]